MNYPTLEEVETATRPEILRWYRFLRSPGLDAIDKPNFSEVIMKEARIMDRICARFKEVGGFTPELSKQIGWEER